MIKLIVGLGNIGRKYEHTRHNVGFAVITQIAKRCGKRLVRGLGKYGVTKINYEGNSAYLIRPRTYMNNSGIAVKLAAERFGVNFDEILIIYDDYYLPLGRIRVRPKGSHGGHNGMESIIDHMQTNEIKRVRVGVGPLPKGLDPAEFVLDRFLPKEVKNYEKVLGKSADAVLYLLAHRIEDAMGKYNINPASEQNDSEAV